MNEKLGIRWEQQSNSSEPLSYCMDIGLLEKGNLRHLMDNHKLELVDHAPDEKFNYPTTFMIVNLKLSGLKLIPGFTTALQRSVLCSIWSRRSQSAETWCSCHQAILQMD